MKYPLAWSAWTLTTAPETEPKIPARRGRKEAVEMILDAKAKVLVVQATKPLLGPYSPIVGNATVVSERVKEDHLFTSIVTHRFKAACRETADGQEEFSREMSFVPEIAMGKLDDSGIIRAGEYVGYGDILVGKIVWKAQEDLPGSERMVAAIFKEDDVKVAIEHNSLYWELADPGLVTETTLKSRQNNDPLPEDILASAEVEVSVRRELQIGDILRDNQGHQLIVAGIIPEDAMPKFNGESVDVLIHPEAQIVPLHKKGQFLNCPEDFQREIDHKGESNESRGDYVTLTKTTLAREDKFVTRSTGRVKQLSLMPSDELPRPAQKVGAETIQTLLRLGLVKNAREMLTVKADCIVGKQEMYETLLGKSSMVTDAITETAFIITSLLQGMGFLVRLQSADGQELILEEVDRQKVDGLRLQTANDKEILSWSRGVVKEAISLSRNGWQPEPNGLLCEQIFGPIAGKYTTCRCGKRQGDFRRQGIICRQCGTEVADRQAERRRHFGHIELAAPMINPWTGQKMQILPILPADLRSSLKGRQFTEIGANHLYRRIVSRNNRLGCLIATNVPDSIIKHEKVFIQEGIDRLFDNRLFGNTAYVGENDKPLMGLSDELESAIRHLFDKRVDFSACGTVVPEPALFHNEISLPTAMAVEICKPLVAGKLIANGEETDIKSAYKRIEAGVDDIVFIVLEEVITSRPVIVIAGQNEVAVLQPQLREDEAIGLHPATAAKLGLKFAGDKVQIHLPLSDEAVAEARSPSEPILPETNLASLTKERVIELAKSGEVLPLTPFDQMVLGLG